MTEKEIEEIKALNLPIVNKLLEEYNLFVESPYASSYKAVRKTIIDLNDQLKNHTIDLFSDKEDKGYDRTVKYFVELEKILNTLEFIRGKMLPEDASKIDEEIRSKKLKQGTALAI